MKGYMIVAFSETTGTDYFIEHAYESARYRYAKCWNNPNYQDVWLTQILNSNSK